MSARPLREPAPSNKLAARSLSAGMTFFGRQAKLQDLLRASPLILWYGWSFVHGIPGIVDRFRSVETAADATSAMLSALAQMSLFLFGAMLVLLLIVRRPPVLRYGRFTPKLIALLGCYLGIAFLVLPVAPHDQLRLNIASFLIFSGIGFSLFSVFWLGRSFSIMPESRKLVTSGPYALVRHPLYLGEQVALVGVALACEWNWALSLFVLQACCQLYRMRYEEEILTSSFPEYEDYCRTTARILPWLY